MLETEIVLDFCCCHCDNLLGVTLKCEGEGLACPDARALAKIPCPHCHRTNHLVFTPDDGQVIDVIADLEVVYYKMPEPSLN